MYLHLCVFASCVIQRQCQKPESAKTEVQGKSTADNSLFLEDINEELLCVSHLQLQSDQDHGNGLVKYVLSGEGAGTIFVIDENNGDLHATRRLDREEKAFYILKATVVNKRTGQKLEPETEFIIKLHDINDNEPHFSQEVYTGTVPERSDIGEESLCCSFR